MGHRSPLCSECQKRTRALKAGQAHHCVHEHVRVRVTTNGNRIYTFDQSAPQKLGTTAAFHTSVYFSNDATH